MAKERGKAARTFEELDMFQRARELTNAIYRLSAVGGFAQDRGLRNQIRRASISIMSNIAEGFERGSTVEFIQFLYIAKGSCGEVRAQLQIAADQGFLESAQFGQLTQWARRISGMLSNFIAHLQKSGYQGDKQNRPRRQAIEAQQKRLADLRNAGGQYASAIQSARISRRSAERGRGCMNV